MFYNTDDLKTNEIKLIARKHNLAYPEKNYLSAYIFDICNLSDVKIGVCDLRIGHNKGIYYGGNIGYTILEAYRGNHYAAKACELLFKLALKHEMTSLYITCNPENIASRKTCERLKMTLETKCLLPEDNEMYLEGEREKCIYHINLI